jgi:photoactive yellow protein
LTKLKQMLDLVDAATPLPFDPHLVDERSDAELDGLPFGVVGLDEEGIILRYNLYESRFARLDRNQVLGRNFFTEVAPCVRTEVFEGRFRRFVAPGAESPIERFDYVFDFKFGTQEVSIELLRAAGARRFYLLINRTKVAAPRPAIPAAQLAALQRDLAPDESRRGVLRDDLERRFVDAPATLFAALRATCDRLAPETWQLFSTEWGVQWGRRAAVDLEASVLESGGKSLRELPMREVAGIVAGYLAERGWGLPAFDFSPAAEGLLLVELSRSALAEAAPASPRDAVARRSDLACYMVAGCLSAILSSVAGRRLVAREVECVASGAARCSMVVIAHERRAAVDAVLGAGERGFEAIRLALRRAPRMVESVR